MAIGSLEEQEQREHRPQRLASRSVGVDGATQGGSIGSRPFFSWRWWVQAFLLRLQACDEGLRARVDDIRLVERPPAQLRDERRRCGVDLDVDPAILEPER